MHFPNDFSNPIGGSFQVPVFDVIWTVAPGPLSGVPYFSRPLSSGQKLSLAFSLRDYMLFGNRGQAHVFLDDSPIGSFDDTSKVEPAALREIIEREFALVAVAFRAQYEAYRQQILHAGDAARDEAIQRARDAR